MKRAAILFAIVLSFPVAAFAGERGLLWRVVQACVASHDLIGGSFPCLAVELGRGPGRGFAVLRAPFESTHLVVTPTVRTSGIEADRLLAADAPNYFANAWGARHFVSEALQRQPNRDDFALAVNSRPGRSQDQLHIHVDCVRRDVKQSLAQQIGHLHAGTWSPITVLPRAPRYVATLLDEADFARSNIFAIVQAGLGVPPGGMDQVTIVAVAAEVRGKPAFVLLARRRIPNSRDEAHGEALMDHACNAFR